jgi:hypothetical protein
VLLDNYGVARCPHLLEMRIGAPFLGRNSGIAD